MLFLNQGDIHSAVTYEEVLAAIELAMSIYEKEAYFMPPRQHLDHGKNTLLLMPCFTNQTFGIKLVSLFPENAKKNIPVLKGTMILNNGETGEPLAVLDAAALTALRTGAVGGTAVKHLAPADIKTLGVIGAGIQGYYQALFASEVRDISEIYVYDQNSNQLDKYITKISEKRPDIIIHSAKTVYHLLENSQLVVTATNSNLPVLPDESKLLKNKHYVGIGSYKPDMREFPDSLFQMLDAIFIDTDHAVEESGDLIHPLKMGWISRKNIFTLGKLLHKGQVKNTNSAGITLFKSVGMALFDVVVSDLIYGNAVDKGLGTEISL
jgi:ornithine cyclodeaminase